MKTLTIAASNRDRFELNSQSTKLFLRSFESQTCKDFEVIIADGGSKNVNQIKEYFNSKSGISMRVHDAKIGEKFERAKLNNVGIRNATTPYIMTTDVDMCFGPQFVEVLISKLNENVFVESRTMYWKQPIANSIYNGNLDPIKDVESCRLGRVKKRTTAGGCQAAHIDTWNKVNGFDENYVGWGSEDYDLLTRMKLSRAKIVWIGEERNSIMLFHQPHSKNVAQDLKEQAENKRLLNKINGYKVNPNGWGDKE